MIYIAIVVGLFALGILAIGIVFWKTIGRKGEVPLPPPGFPNKSLKRKS